MTCLLMVDGQKILRASQSKILKESKKHIGFFSGRGTRKQRNKATRKSKHEETRTENFTTPIVFGGERKVRGQRSKFYCLQMLACTCIVLCTCLSGDALGCDFCDLGSCVFVHQVEMSRMDRQPADIS